MGSDNIYYDIERLFKRCDDIQRAITELYHLVSASFKEAEQHLIAHDARIKVLESSAVDKIILGEKNED